MGGNEGRQAAPKVAWQMSSASMFARTAAASLPAHPAGNHTFQGEGLLGLDPESHVCVSAWVRSYMSARPEYDQAIGTSVWEMLTEFVSPDHLSALPDGLGSPIDDMLEARAISGDYSPDRIQSSICRERDERRQNIAQLIAGSPIGLTVTGTKRPYQRGSDSDRCLCEITVIQPSPLHKHDPIFRDTVMLTAAAVQDVN